MSAPYLTADATVSARRAADVVTSNTVTYESPTRGVYVGVGGNVVVVGVDNNNGVVTETFKNVGSGTILPVRCRRVNATNTTATDIKALYL